MIRKELYRWLLLIGILFVGISCTDDEIFSSTEIGEGEALVQAEVSFKPFAQGLKGDSRTPGDAIKEIQNLCVLVYNVTETGTELRNSYYYTEGTQPSENEYKITEVDRKDADADNGKKAENQTDHAEFKLKLPYGTYKIYAVANMGNLATNNTYKDQINNVEDLKSIPLSWNASDVGSNNQMFGHFTVKDAASTSDEMVVVNKTTPALHAWIKRAASKVTVAFNGANLNENVYITIKSVQIKDIPKTCLLGLENTPDADENLITDGEKIEYKNKNGAFPIITKGGVDVGGSLNVEGWKTDDGSDKDFDPANYDEATNISQAHTENNVALYFYENVQGIGTMENRKDDKSVDKLIYTEKGKEYGSYIEVNASYENRNPGKVSSGNIVYRFMLGKNETTDYNAERNYHYKLTLCFNNDANDVDWRIDYDEDPGIHIPNPYYISYLYNESMMFPLRVILEDGDELVSLTAEIVENNWEPNIEENQTSNSLGNWYGKQYSIYKGVSSTIQGEGVIGKGNTLYPWLGFLSLRDEWKKNENKIWGNETASHPMTLGILENSGDNGYSFTDYVGDTGTENHESWWNNNRLNRRTYYINSNLTLDGEAEYSEMQPVIETKNGGIDFKVPLYTRVKQLFIVSGFTGNNPYQAFNRVARVKFTAVTKNKENPYTAIATIKQARRVVNPTGIYRAANETTPFNVKLMVLSDNGGNFTQGFDFVPLYSDGPWSAKIINGSGWIKINGKVGATASGKTGSAVNFTFAPDGTTDKPRCGVIEVRYHNETCSHLIFVRQGYDPIQLTDNGPEWASFNMKTSTEMAEDPRDEGSLYRYGKWNYPIAEENNMTYGLGVQPGNLSIQGENESISWDNISSDAITKDIGTPISGWRVPTLDDWKNLLSECKVGYGVLYAGEASKTTQTNTTSAFGYRDVVGTPASRGMRGVFVYNPDTGANVFFPIGAFGYGHRKQQHSDGMPGVLRYSTSNSYLTEYANYEYRPMLSDLMDQNGAIYWTDTDGNGWDINYNQLDFNVYLSSNAWKDGTSDALFVRLVKD